MAKQPNTNSPKVPKTKMADGKPSKRIEIILPAARPSIKTTFERVAIVQNCALKTPIIQSAAKPR